MRKFVGVLQMLVAVLLFAFAGLSLLTNIIPALLAEGLSSYAIGRVVGGLFVVVLFVLIGRKSFRAGRARFADAGPTPAPVASSPAPIERV